MDIAPYLQMHNFWTPAFAGETDKEKIFLVIPGLTRNPGTFLSVLF